MSLQEYDDSPPGSEFTIRDPADADPHVNGDYIDMWPLEAENDSESSGSEREGERESEYSEVETVVQRVEWQRITHEMLREKQREIRRLKEEVRWKEAELERMKNTVSLQREVARKTGEEAEKISEERKQDRERKEQKRRVQAQLRREALGQKWQQQLEQTQFSPPADKIHAGSRWSVPLLAKSSTQKPTLSIQPLTLTAKDIDSSLITKQPDYSQFTTPAVLSVAESTSSLEQVSLDQINTPFCSLASSRTRSTDYGIYFTRRAIASWESGSSST
ncbi:hypothetical protein GALMADRAFT_259982 [Galerina marginata CBS 339.88]|uniref:Uncharacterized protein n=1 Tax=Galerina marginata (strain CBS 339.88) TaxID=685588 RepID=A0A067S7P5_GALM3|nr:hypothetical protein GALMADRAFT_259982 [Galerina marginata CBS 339.88]